MSKATENSELQLTEENPFTRLTVKQRRYVEARLQGLVPSAAAKAAGLAHNEERSPRVREALRWAVEESLGSVEDIGKNDVLQGMKDAVSAAATATELIQAWREIGKLIGAYEPERKILEVHDYTKEELKSLSEDDLLRLAGDKMNEAIDGEFYELTAESEADSR